MASLLAALLVVLLGGCASIPADGPVRTGRTGQPDANAGFGLLPSGPADGESPEAIVRGFLLAAAGVEDDFQVARSFLTPTAGNGWRPGTSTVVYGGSAPQVTVLDGSAAANAAPGGVGDNDPAGAGPGSPDSVTVTVGLQVVATIDAQGRYAPSGGDTQEVRFGVQRVSGQWRIGDVADQVLIGDSEFALVYRAYELYFLDPSMSFLVPETRWFPDRPSTATTLAGQLLAGPSPWLAGAVTTAFPPGTSLGLRAVPVGSGTARVDLTGQARDTSPLVRALMQAQLEATLVPVPTVSGVEMTVDGSAIDLPRAPASLQVDPGVGESPVLVQGSALVRLAAGRVTPVEGIGSLDGLGVSHPAVSYGRARYAVLSAQRSQLLSLVPGQETVAGPVVSGADLTAPSFDVHGWLWSTTAACAGVVTAVGPDGSVAQVAAPWLDGRRVTSLRVSREGTRVVVAATDTDGRGHVDVAGVVRDAEAVPVALTEPGPGVVGFELGSVTEAVWVDEVRVAALGRQDKDAADGVHVLRLGGPAPPPLSPVPGAVSLAAALGERSVVVGTGGGELLVQAGAVWVGLPEAQGARDPAFPG